MTVNELVTTLAQFPGDANVMIMCEEGIDAISAVSQCIVEIPGEDIEVVIISGGSAEPLTRPAGGLVPGKEPSHE